MKCERCGGSMIKENFFDSIGGGSFWGWKCINCGEVLDRIIVFNRIKNKVMHWKG